jgi:hypothetical protein
MTPHKKEWKLKKAKSIQKLQSLDDFAALLADLDIISIDDYLDIVGDCDSQISMIASTVYEAENDEQ